MEVNTVAQLILSKIKLLEKGRTLLEESANHKAETIANYEKALAKITILLKNSDKPIKFEDELIEKAPATLIPQIAKGLCWREKLEMDKAETTYKVYIEKLRCIQAELNGLQSINRYSDSIGNEKNQT